MNNTTTQAAYYTEGVYMGLTLPVLFWVIIANTLTIIAIARNAQLRTKTYHLVGCLSGVDLSLGLVYLIIFPINVVVNSRGLLSDNAGLSLCATIISIWVGSALNSLYHLLFIAVDRYIAVYYALRYEELFTEITQRRMVICSWCMSHIQGFLIFAWKDTLHPHCVSGIMLPPPAYIVPFVVVPIYLCTCIIIVLYIRIFAAARSHARRINQIVPSMTSNQQNQEQEMMRIMLKQAKMFFMIIGIFMVCVFPITFFILTGIIVGKELVLGDPPQSIRTSPMTFLITANSGMNFFVYVYNDATFRKTIKSMFVCRPISSNNVNQ